MNRAFVSRVLVPSYLSSRGESCRFIRKVILVESADNLLGQVLIDAWHLRQVILKVAIFFPDLLILFVPI